MTTSNSRNISSLRCCTGTMNSVIFIACILLFVISTISVDKTTRRSSITSFVATAFTISNSQIRDTRTTGQKNVYQLSSSSSRLYLSVQDEKLLRQEIADRQSNVGENDAKYAVPDGAFLETLDEYEQQPQQSSSTTVSDTIPTTVMNGEHNSHEIVATANTELLLQKMKRMTEPRPYPLFLAEKAVELVEATLSDLFKSSTSQHQSNDQSTSTTNSNSQSNNKKTKEKIVILGTGWGGATFLKTIDTDLYDVTIISPRNYFVFTPMLAGASVGTVEYRSICEPVREISKDAQFLEATATSVNPIEQTVTCESVVCDGNSCDIEDFTISYDFLIVSVGAQTNTFGIPGVREHCNFLRQIEDARRIRTAIVNCFERANLPSLSDEEKEQNLTFAVIGAGPTGIEFAAELRDFVEQDGPKYYPNLLKHVRIKVIEASGTILAPFDKSLQQEAINQMNRAVEIQDPAVRALIPERFQLTELLLDSSVQEVGENTILLKDGSKIPYGLSVWAAGNGPIALTLNLISVLGPEQELEQSIARGRIAIDPWMRVIGSKGKILSFGDCTCIPSGQLPATAQVASQQGEYLAGLLNRKYNLCPNIGIDNIFPPPTREPQITETSLSDTIANLASGGSINNMEYAKPFQFLNLGILAYTGGGSALAQVTPAPNAPAVKGSGKIGNAVWKSVYLSKQFSMRNRLLILNDWTNRQLFGRDITRL